MLCCYYYRHPTCHCHIVTAIIEAQYISIKCPFNLNSSREVFKILSFSFYTDIYSSRSSFTHSLCLYFLFCTSPKTRTTLMEVIWLHTPARTRPVVLEFNLLVQWELSILRNPLQCTGPLVVPSVVPPLFLFSSDSPFLCLVFHSFYFDNRYLYNIYTCAHVSFLSWGHKTRPLYPFAHLACSLLLLRPFHFRRYVWRLRE